MFGPGFALLSKAEDGLIKRLAIPDGHRFFCSVPSLCSVFMEITSLRTQGAQI